MLSSAWDKARKLGHNYVNVEHLFLSYLGIHQISAKVLQELGLDPVRLRHLIFNISTKTEESRRLKIQYDANIRSVGRDLTWLAKDQKLDPVIGRHNEIERIIQILSRRGRTILF